MSHFRSGHIDLQGSLRGRKLFLDAPAKRYSDIYPMWSAVYYSRAMGGNMRTVFQRHLPVMKQHPTLDVDAVLANPNLTLYEFDNLVTRVCGGFVSPAMVCFPLSPTGLM